MTDTITNNFGFHDKIIRAIAYGMKSFSYKEGFHGSALAEKLSKTGSLISFVRQTFRVGGELSVFKAIIDTISKRKSMPSWTYYAGLLECLTGVYFYIFDHIEWMNLVHIIHLTKEKAQWVSDENINGWLYSVIAATINRVAKLYLNFKEFQNRDQLT